MARVTKIIHLPTPFAPVPAVSGWGVAQLMFNPIAETASVLLVAVDETGAQVAGGATKSFGVSGAGYQALFNEQFAASIVGLILTAGRASNLSEIPEGSAVVDAEPVT
jgi:hypothetical protein